MVLQITTPSYNWNCFAKGQENKEKIRYVQAFVSLYHEDLAKKGNNLMIQRKELDLKLPDRYRKKK